jgi:hypothetical protein
VPLDRKLMNTRGGPDDVDKRKLLTLPWLELRHLGRVVKPIASHYTDCAVLHIFME